MSLRGMLLVGVLAVPILSGSPGSAEDLREEVRKGWDLTPEQAAALEQQLATNPQDLNSRAQLLGYYFRHHRADPSRKAEHVLWFIENAPESEVLDGPEASIFPMTDPDGYMQTKEAWLGLIEDAPQNAAYLRHAAGFFTLSDTELSADLLGRAETLEPSDPQWARESGSIHWRQARNPRGENDPAEAARARRFRTRLRSLR